MAPYGGGLARVLPTVRFFQKHPWRWPTARTKKLPMDEAIEEECRPHYNPAHFYPVRLWEVANNRYQLASKLGYGSGSTVWLARDLNRWLWQKDKYVALKIHASAHPFRENAAENELDILRHIAKANPSHKGWRFVRYPIDSFDLPLRSVLYPCLVFEPLREPLWLLRYRFIDSVIPPDILKVLVQMILHGLDYLHSECRIIHADLQPRNIMLAIEDPSIFEIFAKHEYCYPLQQKVYPDGRIIYLTRNNFPIYKDLTGILQIIDFDLSVRGDWPNRGYKQAGIYRAPEVILDAGYSYSSDIWSLGVLLWDLLECKRLFKEVGPFQVKEYDERNHLAHIAALLGPPPKTLLDKGTKTNLFYKPNGEFEGPTVTAVNFNFDNAICRIHGEEKRMFIQFVQRMLKWLPEERSTATELLQDPWLFTGLDEDSIRTMKSLGLNTSIE